MCRSLSAHSHSAHSCSANVSVQIVQRTLTQLTVYMYIHTMNTRQDFTWWARNWNKSLFAKRQALVSGVRPCNDHVLFEIRSSFYTYTYTSRSDCLRWAYLLWRFVHQRFLQSPLLPSGNCILIWWITENNGSEDEKWNLSWTLRLDASQQWRNFINKIHLGTPQMILQNLWELNNILSRNDRECSNPLTPNDTFMCHNIWCR